ncbi:uncharacterized protein JCM10292_005826 [Rhodotorula paludigena]|uniref:uncharacterized protein n=1 Tax=Rhodotorula paludigena TaxID=86838 RepID=UPI003174B532
MAASPSTVEPFKQPLLPFSSPPPDSPAKPFSSSSLSRTSPPSTSAPRHVRHPSLGARLAPRRALSIPLALVGCVALLLLVARPSSSSSRGDVSEGSAGYAYLHRQAAGWIPWRNDRTSSGSEALRNRVAPASCAEDRTPEELDKLFEQAKLPLEVGASTEERLRVWEDEAPGWGVEPAEWVAKNLETCPSHRIKPNQNLDLLNNAHLTWAAMSTKRIMELRKEMVAYLRRREKDGAMGEKAWGQGKGLVFTAGNADTFSRVLLTLKMLKNHLHTSLPAEIFSFPGEEPSPEVRDQLEQHGAKLRIVEGAARDTSRTKNYHIKATAIIRSSFREVLFLDSDNIPAASLMPLDSPVPAAVLADAQNATDPWTRVRDDGAVEEVWGKPTGLWEAKAYERLGVMFWPDYWRTQADNPIWALIGVPCRDEWEQEAGTILVDKRKHLDALLLAEWMMDTERFKFWFNFSDGDKDMFRFAFLALRKRWGVPGRYVSVGALPRNTMSGFCGHTMLQNDHLGRPLFVHANLLKQIPSGVGKGFAWGRHRQIRTQPSTHSLQGTGARTYASSALLEAADPLVDEDADCDDLADAENDGTVPRGREGRSARTRRRAVVEKGMRAHFHGGWVSALCIDYSWSDPRSSEELATARLSVAATLPNPSSLPLSQLADEAGIDLSYTAAGDGFELRFVEDEATEVVAWKDDARLRGFEEAFFAEGGKLNGKGF